jgi:hypothetical protein
VPVVVRASSAIFVPAAAERGERRRQVRHEVRDVVQPALVRRVQVAQRRRAVVVLRDQLDHHVAGLAVRGGVVERRGRAAVERARERDVLHHEERPPAELARVALGGRDGSGT